MSDVCTSCGAVLHVNSVSAIIHRVARYSSVSVADIVGPPRHRSIAYPRLAVYYLARIETSQSYRGIGRVLGSRDHSTILSGIKTAKRLIRESPEFAELVARSSRDYRDDEPELRLVA